MPQPRTSSLLFILTGLLCLLSSLLPQPGWTLELHLSTGAGYDDNPAELEKNRGSGYAEIRLEGEETFTPLSTRPELHLGLQAYLVSRFYDKFADTREIGAEGSAAWPLAEGAGHLEFFLGVADCDNPEIEDQDFNRLEIGGRIGWEPSPRLSLLWENGLSWEDYESDDEIAGPSPKAQAGAGGHKPNAACSRRKQSSHPGPGRPPHHNRGERSDRVIASSIKAFFALNPFLDTSAEIYWQNRHSSFDAEKSSTWGGGLQGFWHFTGRLELELSVDAARTAYRYALHGEKRSERNYGAGLGLNYDFDRHWSWSGGWEWLRQDSRIDSDDYTRNQWYSRINFSY